MTEKTVTITDELLEHLIGVAVEHSFTLENELRAWRGAEPDHLEHPSEELMICMDDYESLMDLLDAAKGLLRDTEEVV